MSTGGELPREVVVRFVRTDAYEDPVFAERARQVLQSDERQALARLRPARARRDYLAAHWLARMMLAELAGSDPCQLHLRFSRRGRPEIVTPPGAGHLCFSISHADGVALCAVAAGYDLGADVESLRNIGPDPLGLAEAVCSRRERDVLVAMPAFARSERLLSIWTLKEAITKAMGVGFQYPFARITIHWKRSGPASVEFDSMTASDASQWRLASWCLTPYHAAAVAVVRKSANQSRDSAS